MNLKESDSLPENVSDETAIKKIEDETPETTVESSGETNPPEEPVGTETAEEPDEADSEEASADDSANRSADESAEEVNANDSADKEPEESETEAESDSFGSPEETEQSENTDAADSGLAEESTDTEPEETAGDTKLPEETEEEPEVSESNEESPADSGNESAEEPSVPSDDEAADEAEDESADEPKDTTAIPNFENIRAAIEEKEREKSNDENPDEDDMAGTMEIEKISTGTAFLMGNLVLGLATILLLVLMRFTMLPLLHGNLFIMAYVDGKPVGAVDKLSYIPMIRTSVEGKYTTVLGHPYHITCDIQYRYRFTQGDIPYLSYEDCRDLLEARCTEAIGEVYSLYLDGTYVASVRDRDEIDKSLKLVEEYLLNQERAFDAKAVEVRLTNRWETVKEKRPISSCTDANGILFCLTKEDLRRPSDPVRTSDGGPAESGDLREGQSGRIEVDFSDAVNDYLDYGVPIVRGTASESVDLYSMLSYDTVTYEVYTEIIPYTVIDEESPYYYDDMYIQTQDGSDGIVENVIEVIWHNKETVSTSVYSTNVISEMKPEIHTRGTTPAPDPVSTGTFIWPLQCDFMLSSLYGINRGAFDGEGFHSGLDLACEEGEYIYAADGGVVTWVGRKSTYGILVTIQHDSTYSTYYAHMSEALVEVGDKVYQGKIIGKVGMTGATTAPHVHFEIRKNEYPVNPASYLPEH